MHVQGGTVRSQHIVLFRPVQTAFPVNDCVVPSV